MQNKNITSPTATKILAAWQREGSAERPRTYLGASIIGHECDTYIWLLFRGVVREHFDGRMYRLFDRGKREEAVFCADLRRIGCEVKEFEENGNQFAVSALGGHFAGHLDGIVRGLDEAPKQWFVAEFKTHSDASFKKLCKDGVERAKPQHYAQMMAYMGHTGLKKALYMAVDKDTDDLWVETVSFDQKSFDALMARAKHIIDTVGPDRCASRPDDFRCRACPCHSICWHTDAHIIDPLVPETCRTCCHASADTEHDGAHWTCAKGHSCTTDGKCEDYMILPTFVCGSVVEGDDDAILYEFERPDNKIMRMYIGPKKGFSAEEAKHMTPAFIESVEVAKNLFPEAKVIGDNALKMKYEGELFEAYFEGTQDKMLEFVAAMFDPSKPIRNETNGAVDYYEYNGGWCLRHDCKTGLFTVFGEKIPF